MIILLQHILDSINESPTVGSILVSLEVYTITSSGGRASHILNIDIRNGYKVVFKILSPYPRGHSLQDAKHIMPRHGGEEKTLSIAENCTLSVRGHSI